jgi:uncharacterized membrane protein
VKKYNKYIALFCMVLLPFVLSAQTGNKPEMADAMRSNGKIYVVVAVCITILVGLFLYLINIDRKLRKME